jgi:tetratricopeptide (TPR) repeat protein
MVRGWRLGVATAFAISLVTVCQLPLPPADAQVDELASLKARVRELYRADKYADAIPIAERYVALAHEKHGDEHLEYATAITWLATFYRTQGRYAEAEPLFKRSLAIDEKALGPEHRPIATDLTNLADLYKAQGRYAEAEALIERSLAIVGAPKPSRELLADIRV